MRTSTLPIALATVFALTSCAGDVHEAPYLADSEAVGDSSAGSESDASSGADPTGAVTDGKTSGDSDDTATTGSPGTGRIRVVHVATGAPEFDVYLSGEIVPMIPDLGYGAASDYFELPSGACTLEVRPAGSSIAGPPAYTGALDVPDDASVTVVAAGLFGSQAQADAFRMMPLVESFDDPGPHRVAVRIVHAGVDAPSIDVAIGNEVANWPKVERFTDSGDGGMSLPSGQLLQVGIVNAGETVTAFTTPALPEGGNVFMIATGMLDALPREAAAFNMLALDENGAIAMIRQNPVVHALQASADLDALDICIGDHHLVAAAEFGDIARLQLPPGDHALELHEAPSDCSGIPITIEPTTLLSAGEQYLTIATGEVYPDADEGDLQLVTFVEEFALDTSPYAVLELIHAASAPALSFGTLDGEMITPQTLVVSDLSWLHRSTMMMVPGTTFDLGVIQSYVQLPTQPLSVIHTPLGDGSRSWMIPVGDISPEGTDQPPTVFVVDSSLRPWVAFEV